ncbi:autotransporter outer membrane beta-barrel domain-containing protein [Alienimonas californiensis]|uniref:Autotransporter beta-domain protein n=1 Tax=Alienimonas californiensis TaxID=2527989 RepID=A0A517P5L2_9PLAN|nr:autotransporter outer membrane beta-barrel domain-containing protein [Alienimonas californiensis]QDT14646.1 Autotransporter beta-domain protein [Alienimonas californiensis]
MRRSLALPSVKSRLGGLRRGRIRPRALLWRRRALPWLSAAAFALAAPAAEAGLLSIDLNLFGSGSPFLVAGTDDQTGNDVHVGLGGFLEVQLGGELITDAFLNDSFVDVQVGGLLSTNVGTDFTAQDGVVSVDGTLAVGDELLVVGGDVLTNAGGSITAAALDQTGGLVQVDGSLSLAGAAFVSDLDAAATLDVNSGGSLVATSLNLSAAGGNGLSVTLDGLVTLNGGGNAADDDVYVIEDGAEVEVGGTVVVTGETAVLGAGSLLTILENGSFTTDRLTIEGGAVVVNAGVGGAADGLLTVHDAAVIGDGAGAGGSLTVFGSASAGSLTLHSDGALSVHGDLTTGALSTAGALFLDAGGVLTAGAVTQSGGLLTLNGTALFDSLALTGGAATVAGDVIVAGAASVDGAGSTLTLAAGTFDADSLSVTAGGVVNVDAAATIAGVTTLDGGTLALRAPGAVFTTDSLIGLNGSVLSIADGAILNARTFSLDGSSTQTVDEGGTLNVQALTFVDGSTLDVSNGGTVRSGDHVHVVAGSHARVNGRLEGRSFLLEGRLSGNGTVVVTGSGPNDYFAACGVIAPGNSPGILTIDGNFVGEAHNAFEMEIAATPPGLAPVAGVHFDRLAVTGAATLDGGRFELSRDVLPGQTPLPLPVAVRYDLLTAAGGLTVLDQPLLVDDFADARFVSFVTPTSYGVISARDGSYAHLFGSTANQAAVGAGLDAVRSAPGLRALRDSLDTLPAEAAAAHALNALSGEAYGSHLSGLNRSSLQFLDRATARDATFSLLCGTCTTGRGGNSGLQGWWDTAGTVGRAEGDGNAAEAEVQSAGTAVGLSQIFGGPNGYLSVGGFYGYESVVTEVDAVRSRAETDAHRFGGEVRGGLGRMYGRLTGFGGVTQTDARRDVLIENPLLPFADRTDASFDGLLAGADAETGLLIGGANAFLAPALGLRYVRTTQEDFVERGGAAALSIDDASLGELRPRVGARAGVRTGDELFAVAGTLEAFYSRDVTAGSTGEATAAFAAAPGVPVAVRGTDFGRDRLTLGPGLTFAVDSLSVGAFYRASLSPESTFHAGEVRVEYVF